MRFYQKCPESKRKYFPNTKQSLAFSWICLSFCDFYEDFFPSVYFVFFCYTIWSITRIDEKNIFSVAFGNKSREDCLRTLFNAWEIEHKHCFLILKIEKIINEPKGLIKNGNVRDILLLMGSNFIVISDFKWTNQIHLTIFGIFLNFPNEKCFRFFFHRFSIHYTIKLIATIFGMLINIKAQII